MQYWIPKAFLLSALVSLSGCSIFTNDAHNKRNYRAHSPVKAPSELTTPAQDPTYKMEQGEYNNDEQHGNLRPPTQIMPIAKGSWIENDETKARIFFDKNEGIDDLGSFIWLATKTALNAENATIAQQTENSLETGWFSVIQNDDSWFWQDSSPKSSQRFKFTLTQKDHKRTASLLSELIDYRSESEPLTPLIKQQLETRVLNQVVAEYDFNYRRLVQELRQRRGINAFELGFDNKGNAALITNQPYQSVFEGFPSFLERLQFTIVEVKPDTGLIIANYEPSGNSVWDSLWDDETLQLPLEAAQYQIVLSNAPQESTSITWLNEQGEALNPQTVSQLQQRLMQALKAQDTTR